jgi:hypothetical protein
MFAKQLQVTVSFVKSFADEDISRLLSNQDQCSQQPATFHRPAPV